MAGCKHGPPAYADEMSRVIRKPTVEVLDVSPVGSSAEVRFGTPHTVP